MFNASLLDGRFAYRVTTDTGYVSLLEESDTLEDIIGVLINRFFNGGLDLRHNHDVIDQYSNLRVGGFVKTEHYLDARRKCLDIEICDEGIYRYFRNENGYYRHTLRVR